MLELLDYLRDINILSICVRVVLALILGGLLGMERGKMNHPAGLRTYMLVCLGSSLVMMTNFYVYEIEGLSDPVRMGAQVVSGIGFLGAGTIIMTSRHQIKGMTTAAGLWTAACSGLAIGAGFYEGALAGGVAIFFVLSIMQRMKKHMRNHSSVIDLYIEFSAEESFGGFLKSARGLGFEISDMQISKSDGAKSGAAFVVLTARCLQKLTHTEMLQILSDLAGVLHMEEIG